MAQRRFEDWLKTMRKTIATWGYYTDFESVYAHVQTVKVELNILNSLVGSKNIKEDFLILASRYPDVMKAIPILLAKRGSEISVTDISGDLRFDFSASGCDANQYALFMEKSGLFDLISNHIVNNLVDYVLGVEVGMDSNARKNRTGKIMENLVESFLVKSGLSRGETYWSQLKTTEFPSMFKMWLPFEASKIFDFVARSKTGEILAIECNFYNAGGSKLNETARSYKEIALESRKIAGFRFVWITDGKGWESAKKNLEEAFDVIDDLYNIQDLEQGAIDRLLHPEKELMDYDEYLAGLVAA